MLQTPVLLKLGVFALIFACSSDSEFNTIGDGNGGGPGVESDTDEEVDGDSGADEEVDGDSGANEEVDGDSGTDEEVDGDCETASDGATYFALCGPSRWEDATLECTSRGLVFGSIRSAAENDFVTELMRESDLYFMPESTVGEAVWLGFSDIAEEGVWVWEDGYTGGYANWSPGEPNDSGGQDCAYLDTNPDTRDGLWDDSGCGAVGGERVFLCTRR